MKNQKVLFFLMGESGTGKDTAADILCCKYNLQKVISRTSRPMRYHAEDSHLFLSMEQMESYKEKNLLLTYTHYDGHIYGALKEDFENKDIFITDPTGIMTFNYDRVNVRTCTIMLTAREGMRIYRMIRRGASMEEAQARAAYDRTAFMNSCALADYTIATDDLSPSETAEQIYVVMQLVNAGKGRVFNKNSICAFR